VAFHFKENFGAEKIFSPSQTIGIDRVMYQIHLPNERPRPQPQNYRQHRPFLFRQRAPANFVFVLRLLRWMYVERQVDLEIASQRKTRVG
jgi:hypothetical protein